jgi:hypothetical protein
MPRVSSSGRWLLMAVLGCALGCGRVRLLEDGTYALTAEETVRDECGILSVAGALWTADFDSAGNLVWIEYRLFPGESDPQLGVILSGAYLSGTERFTADGTAFEVSAPANGQACSLDRVSLHLDADASIAPDQFTGDLTVRFEAEAPDRCVCETRVRLRGVKVPDAT